MWSHIWRILKFLSKEKEEAITSQYKRSGLCPDYLFLDITHLVILEDKHQIDYAPIRWPIGNSVGYYLNDWCERVCLAKGGTILGQVVLDDSAGS